MDDLEAQFLQHLDLLKRGVLSESEFTKANEVARSQSTALEARREELGSWLEEQRTRVYQAQNGETRFSLDVSCSEIQFLAGGQGQAESQESVANGQGNDDLPF